MSRVDVPTLRCDRCEVETQDIHEMGNFIKLTRYHVSGADEWDLCPPCWDKFTAFMAGHA